MNPDTYIAPVFNKFLDIIQLHATYIISASGYVERLKKKRDVLDARKVDMNAKIEDAERKAHKPPNEVVVWKNQVDDILLKINEVVNAYETRSCLCAICSNYKTGHRCDDMIKEVDRLLDGGNQYLNAEMMDCDNSKVPISMRYAVPGSLELNFQKAMEYIEDDHSMTNVIGVWGQGGVGKTTLLKKIHNSCIGCPMFSHVIWIVASSEESNIFKIQSEIGKKLKLNLNENDYVQSKARIIYNFLRNKNFLLFIDDLWKAVDLYEAGVPNPCEVGCGKNRKVVFTTRSKDVCANMEAKRIIEVECLDSTQSWALFKEKVGEHILSSPRISEFAKGVVEECKGLPLALITIGRAMSTKSDPIDWKVALELMKGSQGHNILGTDKALLSVLKISYDFLATDQLRKCFLSISLWPEDRSISNKELIECWMGLDIIDNFESVDEAYRIGHSLIGSLLSASLLEHVKFDLFYADQYIGVKMHDVLRDLALWIASDCGKKKYKWMVKAKTHWQHVPNLEVEWSEIECISFMENGLNKLPSGITHCSNLSTLILRGNDLTSESISICFHNFHSLKYLDLSQNLLNDFPKVICALTELQYLNLSENRIESIPKNLRNLKKLKYLILRKNHQLRNVPRKLFSALEKLLVLDMFNGHGSKNTFDGVGELKWLEKNLLYLGISVWGDKVFNKLLNMSDLRIVALSVQNLHITSFNFMSIIPNPYCLRELSIRECSDGLLEIVFKKNDTRQDHPSINLESFVLMNLLKLERIIWKDLEPKKLFAELKKIRIHHCNLDDITWVIHLPSLISLYFTDCNNMRIAFNTQDNDNNTYDVEPNILTFPSLKFLAIGYMEILEKISTGSLAFPELNVLRVFDCPLLKTLPFEIESTPNIREILGAKNWWDKLEWKDDDSRSRFNQFYRPI